MLQDRNRRYVVHDIHDKAYREDQTGQHNERDKVERESFFQNIAALFPHHIHPIR
jgi:hypothetical protein